MHDTLLTCSLNVEVYPLNALIKKILFIWKRAAPYH